MFVVTEVGDVGQIQPSYQLFLFFIFLFSVHRPARATAIIMIEVHGLVVVAYIIVCVVMVTSWWVCCHGDIGVCCHGDIVVCVLLW